MKFKKVICSMLFLLFGVAVLAQKHQARFESIDVEHYQFEIHLNDTSDCITGKTRLTIKFLKPNDRLVLDLIEKDKNQTGMKVEQITMDGNKLNFLHANNQLKIELGKTVTSDLECQFEIKYAGIPCDGLIISKNKYGDRTFFGDNWPNRARNWLPTVDHPSDKATLEFMVYAPQHYEVVANGYLVEKKLLDDNLEFTYWKENVPLSTKLMVIGVADFAVGNQTECNTIPVTSWVFSKNKKKGFENYRYGTNALCYFSDLIGPYPYEKLAHVQSKTRYGGMENAGCIFYNENSATTDQSQERLFAHEVAHQWFGNSVTEQNWHHVWLSEGFATYLTHIYMQHFYGEKAFKEGLKRDRERVIRYTKQNLSPIIDTTITDYTCLLNTNSYQKASWFLHMLRQYLGDELFFKGLQNYYAEFKNSTALTANFREIMENVSGKNLQSFFYQWLYVPGHPVLNLSWHQKKNTLYFKATQLQKSYLFTFPFELKINYKDGTSIVQSVTINEREQNFELPANKEIVNIEYDPAVKTLFEYSE